MSFLVFLYMAACSVIGGAVGSKRRCGAAAGFLYGLFFGPFGFIPVFTSRNLEDIEREKEQVNALKTLAVEAVKSRVASESKEA